MRAELIALLAAHFIDEANRVPMHASRDMTLKLHWKSAGKRRNVEGYAANLPNRDVEDLVGDELDGAA